MRVATLLDAALAAMLASFACEPLLTGLGAGGYLLVVAPGRDPVLLDFFVEAPGRGADPSARAELIPVAISFGDAVQVFNIGPASVGTFGMPAGSAGRAALRSGDLTELAAPAARLAREGVALNAQQAYIVEILERDRHLDPGVRGAVRARRAAAAAPATARQPELADALERLGAEGRAPFYDGDIAAAVVDWVGDRGGHADRRGLARTRSSTASRSRRVPRARGAHQPAAVGGRDPDRSRAGAARRRARAAAVGRSST